MVHSEMKLNPMDRYPKRDDHTAGSSTGILAAASMIEKIVPMALCSIPSACAAHKWGRI
jgi:hypothetical protein